MLQFSQAAMSALEGRRAEGFILRLLGELTTQFPQLLLPLPLFVRVTMVCNGLDQAAAWGFSLEKTLGQFVALQCASAADFYQSERLRPLLDPASGDEVTRMQRLLSEVPPEHWAMIRRGADLRAWFEPMKPEQRPARIAVRVCSMLPELVQHIPEDTLQTFFSGISARALRHGIDVEAGICVYAAALAFYGERLDQPHGPDWARDIFFHQPPFTPAKIVALLRNALLLDTDRLI